MDGIKEIIGNITDQLRNCCGSINCCKVKKETVDEGEKNINEGKEKINEEDEGIINIISKDKDKKKEIKEEKGKIVKEDEVINKEKEEKVDINEINKKTVIIEEKKEKINEENEKEKQGTLILGTNANKYLNYFNYIKDNNYDKLGKGDNDLNQIPKIKNTDKLIKQIETMKKKYEEEEKIKGKDSKKTITNKDNNNNENKKEENINENHEENKKKEEKEISENIDEKESEKSKEENTEINKDSKKEDNDSENEEISDEQFDRVLDNLKPEFKKANNIEQTIKNNNNKNSKDNIKEKKIKSKNKNENNIEKEEEEKEKINEENKSNINDKENKKNEEKKEVIKEENKDKKEEKKIKSKNENGDNNTTIKTKIISNINKNKDNNIENKKKENIPTFDKKAQYLLNLNNDLNQTSDIKINNPTILLENMKKIKQKYNADCFTIEEVTEPKNEKNNTNNTKNGKGKVFKGNSKKKEKEYIIEKKTKIFDGSDQTKTKTKNLLNSNKINTNIKINNIYNEEEEKHINNNNSKNKENNNVEKCKKVVECLKLVVVRLCQTAAAETISPHKRSFGRVERKDISPIFTQLANDKELNNMLLKYLKLGETIHKTGHILDDIGQYAKSHPLNNLRDNIDISEENNTNVQAAIGTTVEVVKRIFQAAKQYFDKNGGSSYAKTLLCNTIRWMLQMEKYGIITIKHNDDAQEEVLQKIASGEGSKNNTLKTTLKNAIFKLDFEQIFTSTMDNNKLNKASKINLDALHNVEYNKGNIIDDNYICNTLIS